MQREEEEGLETLSPSGCFSGEDPLCRQIYRLSIVKFVSQAPFQPKKKRQLTPTLAPATPTPAPSTAAKMKFSRSHLKRMTKILNYKKQSTKAIASKVPLQTV